jgi:hypothetical protein
MYNELINEADIVNLTPELAVKTYGPNWRSLPKIYLSGGLAANEHGPVFEDHLDIAYKLAPHFLTLSPLRGVGHDVPRYGAPDAPYARDQEVRTRDLSDVREAKVILLNAQPQSKIYGTTVDQSMKTFPQTRLVPYRDENGAHWRDKYIDGSLEVSIDVPFTGTICEIFYAAYVLNKPVVAYNWDKRGRQSPIWFEAWVSKAFNEVDDAVRYIHENWSY